MQNSQFAKSIAIIGFSLVGKEIATIKSEIFPFVTFCPCCCTMAPIKGSLCHFDYELIQFSKEKVMRSPYNNPSLSHVLMYHHHVLSVKNRAANTTNVCGSLFQMSLLFQEIPVNWFSPKLFPTLLCFLFVIRLLPQVWSVALMSPKDFQFPFMAFGFNSTH